MVAQPAPLYSREDYLDFERQSNQRHEFWAGEIVAMAGGTAEHDVIFGNTFHSLYAQLRGRPCRVYSSNMRVAIPGLPGYTYPDLAAVCGTPQFEDARRDILLNPILLIEILSPSTERYDRTRKFRRYQQLPSFEEYLLIAQDTPLIEQFLRQPDGQWAWSSVEGLGEELVLPTIGCTLRLAEVYHEVDLTPS